MSVQRELQRRVRSEQSRPRFEPYLPRVVKQPLSGSDWLHEIKRDGFRIIGMRDGTKVRSQDARPPWKYRLWRGRLA